MLSRCLNKNDNKYYLYGGRGITICNEWIGENGFLNFYNWSIENGYDDKLTIDRINSNGGYSPDNCRWATIFEQNNNTNRNVFVEIDGISKTIGQWAREYNLKYDLVWKRYEQGLTGRELLEQPKQKIHSAIMVVDESGTHEFANQKEAGKYLGVSGALISCILNGTRDNYTGVVIQRKGY